jgi:hypothetical protein
MNRLPKALFSGARMVKLVNWLIVFTFFELAGNEVVCAQNARALTQVEAGRLIYEAGVTVAGAPLVGVRPGGQRSPV